MNTIKKICGVPLTATPTGQPIFKGARGNETVEVRASYQNNMYVLDESLVTKGQRGFSFVKNTSHHYFDKDKSLIDPYLTKLNQSFNKGTGACAIQKNLNNPKKCPSIASSLR